MESSLGKEHMNFKTEIVFLAILKMDILKEKENIYPKVRV